MVPANVVAHVRLSLAGVPLFRFTRSVFRPDAAWARRLEWDGTAMTFAALPALWLDGGFASEQAGSLLLVNGSRALACAGSLAEVLRYRALMLRRAAVGLAGGGGAEYLPVVLHSIRGVLGASPVVAMVALQLTFSPPRAYFFAG